MPEKRKAARPRPSPNGSMYRDMKDGLMAPFEKFLKPFEFINIIMVYK